MHTTVIARPVRTCHWGGRGRFARNSAPALGRTSSTIAAKIAVHSPASPQSNPNISRFAPIAVAFWADSNCDLPVPVCRALLDNNKKTETGNAPRCVSIGEHHHGDDGLPSVQGVEGARLRTSRITSVHRILHSYAR